MAYNARRAKKARFHRESGTGASPPSNAATGQPKETSKCNDDYSTALATTQEEIAKKATPKRRRAMDMARVMDGVGADLDYIVTVQHPKEGAWVRPIGYKVSRYQVWQRPYESVEHGTIKGGPRTAQWWQDHARQTRDCGSYLEYHIQPQAYKLMRANLCRNRLCPLCAWRRSLKIYGQMSRTMDYLTTQPETRGYRYIFLTLTLRNCSADELPGVIDRMRWAWRAITRGGVLPERRESHAYSWLAEHVIRGAYRTLEVTVNYEHDTYHPHYHVVVAVPYNYYWRSNPWYMTHDDWMTLWRCALGVDYDPSVRVEAIEVDPDRGYSPAVSEVSKYVVKDSDYLGVDIPYDAAKEYVYALANGIYGRRLLAWSGCFAAARRALGLVDPETGDITDDEITTLRDDVRTLVRVYRWRVGVVGGYERDEHMERRAEREIAAQRGVGE